MKIISGNSISSQGDIFLSAYPLKDSNNCNIMLKKWKNGCKSLSEMNH